MFVPKCARVCTAVCLEDDVVRATEEPFFPPSFTPRQPCTAEPAEGKAISDRARPLRNSRRGPDVISSGIIFFFCRGQSSYFSGREIWGEGGMTAAPPKVHSGSPSGEGEKSFHPCPLSAEVKVSLGVEEKVPPPIGLRRLSLHSRTHFPVLVVSVVLKSRPFYPTTSSADTNTPAKGHNIQDRLTFTPSHFALFHKLKKGKQEHELFLIGQESQDGRA